MNNTQDAYPLDRAFLLSSDILIALSFRILPSPILIHSFRHKTGGIATQWECPRRGNLTGYHLSSNDKVPPWGACP